MNVFLLSGMILSEFCNTILTVHGVNNMKKTAALLLCLVLLCSAAGFAAADTQEVADAAALAGDNIVAEYYPGIHSRIYLRGLSNEALDRVIKKYEQKTRKKLIMR